MKIGDIIFNVENRAANSVQILAHLWVLSQNAQNPTVAAPIDCEYVSTVSLLVIDMRKCQLLQHVASH